MLTVVHNTESANGNVSGGAQSLLIGIVRDGARQMLAATLKAEVAAYIDAHAHEVDDNGHRLVVGNGHHHEREVLTAAAAVSVSAPRVGDKRFDPDTVERQRFPRRTCPGRRGSPADQ